MAVKLDTTNSHLRAEVIDDGIGFETTAAGGSGLRGLADRLEALGGTMRIESELGLGTRLVAEIPVEERARA